MQEGFMANNQNTNQVPFMTYKLPTPDSLSLVIACFNATIALTNKTPMRQPLSPELHTL